MLGLATWRLTSLLSIERGPKDVFVKLRELMGITHYDSGIPFEYPDKFWAQLFSCVWCLSVWVAGTMVLLYIFLPNIAIYFSLWLGLSTITILLNKVL